MPPSHAGIGQRIFLGTLIMKFSKGDLVQTMFDTGQSGHQVLYGKVVKAGKATVTIVWESGLRNRVVQGWHGVIAAKDQEEACREVGSQS
jgi:hypothetical protein